MRVGASGAALYSSAGCAAAVAGVGEKAAKALLQPRPHRQKQAHQPCQRPLWHNIRYVQTALFTNLLLKLMPRSTVHTDSPFLCHCIRVSNRLLALVGRRVPRYYNIKKSASHTNTEHSSILKTGGGSTCVLSCGVSAADEACTASRKHHKEICIYFFKESLGCCQERPVFICRPVLEM